MGRNSLRTISQTGKNASKARCCHTLADRLALLARSVEERHQLCFFLFDLIEPALLGRLIGAPAQEPRAMPKALAGEMIVTDLDHELRLERHPLAEPFCRPAAGAARCVAGKAGRPDQRFQFLGEARLILAF